MAKDFQQNLRNVTLIIDLKMRAALEKESTKQELLEALKLETKLLYHCRNICNLHGKISIMAEKILQINAMIVQERLCTKIEENLIEIRHKLIVSYLMIKRLVSMANLFSLLHNLDSVYIQTVIFAFHPQVFASFGEAIGTISTTIASILIKKYGNLSKLPCIQNTTGEILPRYKIRHTFGRDVMSKGEIEKLIDTLNTQ